METGFLREHNAEFTLSREKGGTKTFHSLVLTCGVYSTSAWLLCTLKDPRVSFTSDTDTGALFLEGEAVHSFSTGSIYFNEKPMHTRVVRKQTRLLYLD